MKNPLSHFGILAVLLLSFTIANTASANHTWGNYHWARATPSFTLLLGNNLSNTWDPFLDTTSSDWSTSTVLNTVVVAGNTNDIKGKNTPKNCTPTSGRGEVCNAKYGANGWLGIASIWASGNHITAGTVKLNDTYFSTATYNRPAWRNMVMCQEVGHIFGLGHQDETFDNTNLDTCMDYTNNPESNQHPNQHDYDLLDAMYAHLDTTTTVASGATTLTQDSNDVNDWGNEVHRSDNGRASIFVKDVGNGNRVLRHVYWTEPRGNDHE